MDMLCMCRLGGRAMQWQVNMDRRRSTVATGGAELSGSSSA